MIQLIIIDDNPIILKGLALRIPYAELGLELLGTYQSAAEALADLRSDRPCVVLTDIAMPDMDGLDFIELAQKRAPLCAFICITGYEKIEYMHRAIECQVTAYLNKPIDDEKLCKALTKAVNALNRQMEYDSLRSSRRLQRNAGLLVRMLNGEAHEDLCADLAAKGTMQNEICLRVIADASVRSAFDAVPGDCAPEALDGLFPVDNLLFALNDAACTAVQELPVRCSVSVSRSRSGDLCADLTALVQDAHEAVYGRRPGSTTDRGASLNESLSRLRLLTQMRRTDDAVEYAASSVGEMLRAGCTLEELGEYMHGIEHLLSAGTVNELRFPLLAFCSIGELKQWIRNGVNRSQPQKTDAAAALYRYIRENVSSPLSLRELGGVAHMHPNYIGKLIRDRYDLTFNDLLNKLRIDLAMELLRADPDACLSELAGEVGYSDPKYFSRVFKLRTGLSPSAYARRMRS